MWKTIFLMPLLDTILLASDLLEVTSWGLLGRFTIIRQYHPGLITAGARSVLEGWCLRYSKALSRDVFCIRWFRVPIAIRINHQVSRFILS